MIPYEIDFWATQPAGIVAHGLCRRSRAVITQSRGYSRGDLRRAGSSRSLAGTATPRLLLFFRAPPTL